MRGLIPVLVLGFRARAAALQELVLPSHFDPYAASAPAQYRAAAAAAYGAPKAAGFIGYRWRLPLVAAELRAMTGSSEGKQVYIGFLKSKYGYQIAEVNRVYGLDAQSFTELQESPIVLKAVSEAVRRDDAEFDFDARREMVGSILKGLRECDPTHADGGLKLLMNGLLH
jgi:hypothetical protein